MELAIRPGKIEKPMDGRSHPNELVARLGRWFTELRARPLTRILPIGAVVLLAFLVPGMRSLVNESGHGFAQIGIGIHETDPVGDYLVGWFYAVIILCSILFWPVRYAHKGLLLKMWLVRCLVTLGLMLVYEGYYSLDAYEYFHESRYPVFRWPVSMGDNWSVMSYMAWWINQNLLIADSYHALKVIFSLLGLLGSYFLYLGIVRHSRAESAVLFVFLQVLPSMLFWSSILGKDPVNFFAICLYAYGVLSWLSPVERDDDEDEAPTLLSRWPSIVAIAGGIWIAFLIRPWTAQILMLPLVVLALNRIRWPFVRVIAYGIVPFVLNKVVDRLLQKFGIATATDLLAITQAISRSWSRGGSALEVPNFTSVWDVAAFAPLGMFTALFRPLPGEVMNPFGMLAGVENLALLILLLMGAREKWRNWGRTPPNERALIVWAVMTVLGWSFVYGFVSYQNLGAAFRFRLQILPVLILLVIFLNFDPEKPNLLLRVREGLGRDRDAE